MQLSDVWMAFVFLALAMYIVLDGYDLGIGMLTLVIRDDDDRRAMYQLVAQAWDGNESWLVLIALSLWAGVPLVVGVALPALYVVLVPMLWSLILRGVSIEFVAQQGVWNRRWGFVFAAGSLLSAFCQGAAFGGLVAGLPVRRATFAGGPFTFLHHGYAVLSGVTAIMLYAVAATAWVHLKSDGDLRRRVDRIGRVALPALAVGTAASWLLAPVAGSLVLHPTESARPPVWITGAIILAAGLVFAFTTLSDRGGRRAGWLPMAAVLAIDGGGLLLAGGLLYPEIVPPSVTVHQAASPHSSLLFLIIGVGLFIPVIFAYQSYGFWVFRAKVDIEPQEPVR